MEKKPNKWTTQTDRRPGEVYATVVWKCDQREKGDMRAIREAIWVTFFFLTKAQLMNNQFTTSALTPGVRT